MIAMKMADKDVVDAATADLKVGELHLGSFATINEEYLVVEVEYLCGRMPAKCRQGGIIT